MNLHIRDIKKGMHFWEKAVEFIALEDGYRVERSYSPYIFESPRDQWKVTGKNVLTGEVINFLSTDGCEYYGPQLYDYQAYVDLTPFNTVINTENLKKVKNMKQEKYEFKSKHDEIYHNNYVELLEAITLSGGNGRFVLKDQENFLRLLANNRISIKAEHLDEEPRADKPKSPLLDAKMISELLHKKYQNTPKNA